MKEDLFPWDDSQLVYLDFDGAFTAYNNSELGLDFSVDVLNSGIDTEKQSQIVDLLNFMYQGKNVTFTSKKPVENVEYSTVYVGKTDAFNGLGDFAGLAETIDYGNKNRSDDAFVMLDKSASLNTAVSVIDHEVGHLLGEEHSVQNGTIEDYAWSLGTRSSFSDSDYVSYLSPKRSYDFKVSSSGYYVINYSDSSSQVGARIQSQLGTSFNWVTWNSSVIPENPFLKYSLSQSQIVQLESGYQTCVYLQANHRYYIYVQCTGNNSLSALERKHSYSISMSPYRGSTAGSSGSVSCDLKPYKPSSWSAAITVANKKGTTKDSTLVSNKTIYSDIAVTNNGPSNLNKSFYVTLYVDGKSKFRQSVSSLKKGYHTYWKDLSIGKLSAGTHELKLKVDSGNNVSEKKENNNTYTKKIRVYSPANLYVKDYKLSTSSVTKFSSVKLSFKISNSGGLKAGAFKVKIYDGSKVLKTFSVSSLASKKSKSFTFTIKGSSLKVGKHSLSVMADANKQVSESNESNNKSSRTLTVKKLADLYIKDYNLSKYSISSLDTVKLTFKVYNSGDISAASSTVKIYDGSKVLKSFSTGTIKAKGYKTYTYTFKGSSLKLGKHTLAVKADTAGKVKEASESNNQSSRALTVTNPADLYIKDLKVSKSSMTSLDSVTLTFKVYNNGAGTAAGSTVRIYDGSKVLKSFSVGSVNSKKYKSYTYTFKGSSLKLGKHTLYVMADSDKKIAETNESNNKTSRTLTILAPADLCVQNYTVSASAVTDSDSVNLNFKIVNNGGVASGASTVKIYDGSTLLRTLSAGSIGAKGSRSFSVTLQGSELAFGNRQITVTVDANGQVKESNESNNKASLALRRSAADLAVTQFSLQQNFVLKDQAVTLNFSVSNLGNIAAGASTVCIYSGTNPEKVGGSTISRGKKLGEMQIDALAAGETRNYTYTFAAGTLDAKTYYLHLEADGKFEVAEPVEYPGTIPVSSNYNNLSKTQTLTVSDQALPDLVIWEDVIIPNRVVGDGERLYMIVTVFNNGLGASEATDFSVFTEAPGQEMKWLGDWEVRALDAGKCHAITVSIDAEKLLAGKQTISFKVNPDRHLTESDWDNNEYILGNVSRLSSKAAMPAAAAAAEGAELADMADYNGDGFADLLLSGAGFEDPECSETYCADILAQLPGNSWQIGGISDWNLDGASELLIYGSAETASVTETEIGKKLSLLA